MPRNVAEDGLSGDGFTKYKPGPGPITRANRKIDASILLSRVLSMKLLSKDLE